MGRLVWLFRAVGVIALGGLMFSGACIGGSDTPQPALDDDGRPLPFDFLLRVARHVDQPFSEAQVDAVLAQASAILFSVENECPDVYCPTTFTRSGGVSVFAEGDAIITIDDQLDEVFAVDADIKIVTFMVGVCGAPGGNDPAVVLGCAATAASVVIVHDAPFDVWAHEWGHVQGLPHRNDCARNLMHAYELETNAVNLHERAALLTPTPGSSFLRLRPNAEGPCTDCLETTQYLAPATHVERVINQRYLQGVPANALGDIPTAQRVDLLLASWGSDAVRCANSARLLGHSQDPRGCAVLMERVGAMQGDITRDEFALLSESLLALARLARADETGAALAVLLDGADQTYWAGRNLALQNGLGGAVDLSAALARVCVMGLGISGHPEARAFLESLRADAAKLRSSDRWFNAQIEAALAELSGDSARLRPIHRLNRQP